ncbi:MAG: zinc dependent phospholipase C family protein [Candidatus Vogelbacteria bacterium]|nr:zinc dependent phospholipase C family protein [Candidatus Vogelbacteria bacterium]
MANQITHIVLSERVADELFPRFNRKDFLIGTVFPDIRYLGVIPREKTHFVGLSLADVLAETNSFMAGMKYHSLVDTVREAYVVRNDIYNKIPASKFNTQALKTFEDEILYEKVSGWDKAAGYFNSVLPEEREFGIKEENLKKWHKILQDYFVPPLSDRSLRLMISGIVSAEVADEMMGLIVEMRGNKSLRELVEKMHEKWGELLLEQ